MSWMVPGAVAALATSAVLAFVYGYLYAQERHVYLKLWVWSWAIYTVRFVFDLASINSPSVPLWIIGQQAAALASSLLLYAGTMRFLGHRMHRFWAWIGTACFVWAVVAVFSDLSMSIVSLPTFVLAGFLYVHTGWVLLQQGQGDLGMRITGWALIGWGIHKWDYPLLRPVLWLAPWGFLLGAVFSQIVAVGTLILYFRQIKAELASSEQRFRRLAENAQDLIYRYRLHPEPGFEYVSPASTAMTGYTPQDHYDDPLLGVKLVHPDDRHLVNPAAINEISVRSPVLIRWLHKDGRILWTEQRNVLIYDEDGQMVALEGIARDVTERVEAEMQSRQQAAREEAINQIVLTAAQASDLRSFAESALQRILAVLQLDIGACWIEEVFVSAGIDPQKIDQLAASAGVHRPNLSRTIIVNDWTEESAETRPVRAWFLEHGLHGFLVVPIVYNGQPLGGIGIADPKPRHWSEHEVSLLNTIGSQLGTVAARLRLLEELRAVTQRLQKVIDAVPEGVCLLDAQYRIVLANSSALTQLRLLSNNGLGDILAVLAQRPIEDLLQTPHEAPWHEIEMNEQVFTVRSQPISTEFVDDGWLLVIRDVTHERAIQDRAQQQDRLAAVGQLAAGIAHDFNNIMAVILLYSQMAVRNDLIPEKVRQQLSSVVEQARRAAELIQQILDFSRHSQIETSRLDLAPFLKEIVKLLERTLPENIDVSYTGSSDGPYVQADPTRLQQVIMNLAVNARDAMPEGGVLRIEAMRKTITERRHVSGVLLEAGEWVKLTIEDTGGGIPASIVPHIFEPFFTTKDKGKGTGLGLAQVYGIVKQHGGEIDVQSTPDQGTCFSIYLPACVDDEQSGAVDPSTLVSAGRGERILVVEDNSAARSALIDTLEMLLGYRAYAAANGQEALHCWQQCKDEITLVISDVVMPQMGGIEFLQHLRSQGATIPVILMTGHASNEDVRQAEADEKTVLLMKPVNVESLSAVVARAIGRSA